MRGARVKELQLDPQLSLSLIAVHYLPKVFLVAFQTVLESMGEGGDYSERASKRGMKPARALNSRVDNESPLP